MNDLEKHIRCNCGKYWGMHNHKRNCKRCKTPVIARGAKVVGSKYDGIIGLG